MVSWTTLVKTELLLLFIAAAAQAVAFWPGSFDINDSLPLALESFVYYGVLRIGGQLVLSTAGLLDRRGYTGTIHTDSHSTYVHHLIYQTCSHRCWLLWVHLLHILLQ